MQPSRILRTNRVRDQQHRRVREHTRDYAGTQGHRDLLRHTVLLGPRVHAPLHNQWHALPHAKLQRARLQQRLRVPAHARHRPLGQSTVRIRRRRNLFMLCYLFIYV